MFEPRWYRKMMEGERFVTFQVSHFETDLWIGIDPYSYQNDMQDYVLNKIKEIRLSLEKYIQENPAFEYSLKPLPIDIRAPKYADSMIRATIQSETGPFSAVAGMFAQEVGLALQEAYPVQEIIIENGGDLFISVKNNLDVAIYAGNSPLSNKIAVEIPANEGSIGLCTSSATVGPSLSLGNTDATMIVCKDAALADAFATRFGNLVKTKADIEKALDLSVQFPEILSILIIAGDQFGVRGKYPIKPIN